MIFEFNRRQSGTGYGIQIGKSVLRKGRVETNKYFLVIYFYKYLIHLRTK